MGVLFLVYLRAIFANYCLIYLSFLESKIDVHERTIRILRGEQNSENAVIKEKKQGTALCITQFTQKKPVKRFKHPQAL